MTEEKKWIKEELESSIQRKIISFLRTLDNTHVYNMHGSTYSGKGRPDIIACINGLFVAIEVKRPNKGKITESQLYELAMLNRCGAITIVATSVDDVREGLKGFLRRSLGD